MTLPSNRKSQEAGNIYYAVRLKAASWDASLNTDVCKDAYTNADLTLTMRLGFRKLFVLFAFVVICSCTISNANGNTAMNDEPTCSWSAIERSQEIIKYILNDISENYTPLGGGGIHRIKKLATNTYVVSINQEERTDEITYEFNVTSDCEILMISRIESAVTR